MTCNHVRLQVTRYFPSTTRDVTNKEDQSLETDCFCRLRRATAGQPGGEVLGASRWWKAGWRRFNLRTQSFTGKKPGPSWLSSLWLDEMCLTSGRSLVYGMLDLWGWWPWSYHGMIRVSLQSQTRLRCCFLSSVLTCWFVLINFFFFLASCFFSPPR